MKLDLDIFKDMTYHMDALKNYTSKRNFKLENEIFQSMQNCNIKNIVSVDGNNQYIVREKMTTLLSRVIDVEEDYEVIEK